MANPTSHRMNRSRRGGFAYLLVMLVISVAVVLSVTFLHGQSTSLTVTQNIIHHSRARAVAESGLELVIAEIRQNEAWRSVYRNGQIIQAQAFAGGTYQVALIDGADENGDGIIETDGDLANDQSDPVTVIVTASVHEVTHTSQATVQPDFLERRIAASGKIEIKKDSVVDSFRSANGAYGGTNVGDEASLTTISTRNKSIKIKDHATVAGNVSVGIGGDPAKVVDQSGASTVTGKVDALFEKVPIPYVNEPTGIPGGKVSSASYSSGTITINANKHFSSLAISGTAIVEIVGRISILVDETFDMKQAGQLRVSPGSQLFLFVKKNISFKDDAMVSVTSARPSEVQITLLGAAEIKAEKNAQIYATIVAPYGKVSIKDDADFYGNIAAKDLKVEGRGAMHQDMSTGYDPSNAVLEADIVVSDRILVEKTAIVDSFDSRSGPYGGTNVGTDALIATNSTSNSSIYVKKPGTVLGGAAGGLGGVPASVIKVDVGAMLTGKKMMLSAPINIPVAAVPETLDLLTPSSGNVLLSSGTTVITGDSEGNYKVGKFQALGTAQIQIQGDVVMYCTGEMTLSANARIIIMPDSSLELYLGGLLTITNEATLNAGPADVSSNTNDPDALMIYNVSNKNIQMKLNSRLSAVIYSLGGKFTMEDTSDFAGNFFGKEVTISDASRMHVNTRMRNMSGGNPNAHKFKVHWIE